MEPTPQTSAEELRREILEKVAAYYRLVHAAPPFIPGETLVHYSGRVFDEREMQAAVDAVLDFWLTDGPRNVEFSAALSRYLNLPYVLTTNSGSSANLIALTALRSTRLEHPMQPGDEVITPAATFATTVAPIVQNGLIPVFIDCKIGSYNLDVDQLEAARSERTRAVMFPHILGNPAEMDHIMEFADRYGLWVIEDTCDALGSRYDGRYCGAIGHIGTFGFYAPHHITTGEGGAIATHDEEIYNAAHTLRDWGKEFSPTARRLPGLDEEYDASYYFTEVGFNMKLTDLQAAIGLPQMEKLPAFNETRRRNFAYLYKQLAHYQEYLILPVRAPKADPAWFAFTLAVKESAPFTRRDFNTFLRERQVETRYLFAGNILSQPAYRNIAHRVAVPLTETERVLHTAMFIGLYPGMNQAHLDYMLQVIEDFFHSRGLHNG